MEGQIRGLERTKKQDYGFIRGTDGVDRFFHRKWTVANFDALRDGDRVRFDHKDHPKGPRAKNVDIIG